MRAISRHQAAIATGALVLIATIASIAALKFAQGFAAPIVLGWVVGIVLAPTVRRLSYLGVPRAVSASLALVVAVALLIVLISLLGPVISGLMEEIPKIQREIRDWLEGATRLLRGIEELENTISEGGEEAIKAAMPGVLDALWLAPNFAAQTMIFVGTLFFFLLTRDEIYACFPGRKPSLMAADRAVSHYFVTVALINAGFGFAVFGLLTLLGLSNAVLWGAATFLLNFVLYLGPLVMVVSLLIAGLTQFNGAMVIVPPLAFLAMNITEAQFVTPTFVGQRLRINPLGVFLAILFGLWLWGPIGGIVSLPVLVWLGAFFVNPGIGTVELTPASEPQSV